MKLSLKRNPLKFLVIEDDELARINLVSILKDHGQAHEASNKGEALNLLAKNSYDIVFIDLDLDEELEGLKIIKKINIASSYVVVLSGHEEDQYIEEAYLYGCKDYLCKPFKSELLDVVLQKYRFFKDEGLLNDFFSQTFITKNPEMLREMQKIKEIVTSTRSVFLKGETGTGKTMVAKLIHLLAHGDLKGFVHLNCSELPESLLESELFGYKKGAFSGAVADKRGIFELADGGTLFLDEIATMPSHLQQKLLRVIEEKSFIPLGSVRSKKSDFRLISATCEDLPDLIKEGKFREDLFYRIDGFNLHLKSLRERVDDIPFLIRHFIRKGHRRIVFPADVMNILKGYSWPGNVRELQKMIEVLQCKDSGIIGVDDLPSHIVKQSPESMQTVCFNNSTADLNACQVEYIRTHGLEKFLESKVYKIVDRIRARENG